jgi:hypothetical protein
MSTLGAVDDAVLMQKMAEMRKEEDSARRREDKRASTINPMGDTDKVSLLNTYVDLCTKERSCTLARLVMATFIQCNDPQITKTVSDREILKLASVFETARVVCKLLKLDEGVVNGWDEEVSFLYLCVRCYEQNL